ncbi:Hypothetical predicted protein [Marmota monax]|uniref:KRAB domain-containing protein n=1 Tax=Marmota monax TaxID=9995 RepID=A0A5E4A9Z4_MARMO|nr:hypothetical protein GHT09_004156 [Marmota monax]VTJ53865.1 Hypothetical predicted protein [Marmota monax]
MCVLFKESVTFEDVAVGLSQEWALLDDVRRDLCRYVLLDNYQTLACRGEAGIAPFLAAYVCRILPQCLPCGRACGHRDSTVQVPPGLLGGDRSRAKAVE